MIKREDWDEAYNILDYVTSNIKVLEQGYIDNLLQDRCPNVTYYDGRLQYVTVDVNSYESQQSLLKFRTTFNNYSFVMGDEHREANVNIRFGYSLNDDLRLGQNVYSNFDYSEENIFQQSLLLPNDTVHDLEFLCFLRSKKLNQSLLFKRNAFSIEGLRMIQKHVKDALCYISETK